MTDYEKLVLMALAQIIETLAGMQNSDSVYDDCKRVAKILDRHSGW